MWHVIVGESFSYDIEYDSEFFYYFFFGPIAVLAFKVTSIKLLNETLQYECNSLLKIKTRA